MKGGWRHDALVSLGVFVVLVVHGIRVNTPDPGAGNLGFAYEYGNIAESVARGQGYASPYGVESGPTALMPPLLPTFIAGVFGVFGVRTLASLWFLLIVKFAALSLTVFLLLRLADGAGHRKRRHLLILILAVPVCLHREWFFRVYLDVWMVSLLVTYLTYSLSRQLRKSGRGTFANLMVLAAVLPLSSPGLAMAFALFEVGYGVWFFLRRKDIGPRLGLGRVAVLLSVFAVSLAPWTVRNYLVFGRFIPTKGSLGFELGQSALDDDGLITIGDFQRLNPTACPRLRREYAKSGEPVFNDRFAEIFREKMRADPWDLVWKVLRRARNAFLYTVNPSDEAPAAVGPDDAAVLERADLVRSFSETCLAWTCLRWPESRVVKTLASLEVRHRAEVTNDWRHARDRLRARTSSPVEVVASLIVSLVPALALLLVLFSRLRRNPAVIASTVVYLLYLAPYVLIVHYVRYQLPLIPLQAFFVFLGLALVLDRRRGVGAVAAVALEGAAHRSAAGVRSP